MVPASTRESTIAEACWDSQASSCWTPSFSVAAASAGTFADASSVLNRSRPTWRYCARSTRNGISARAIRRSAPPTISTAAPIDPPAAFARPQPRARSRSLNGRSVATAITANRMESVTVDRYIANPTTKAPNATVTSTRQPIAARRVSQLGTSQVDGDGGRFVRGRIQAILAASRIRRVRHRSRWRRERNRPERRGD